MNQPNTLNQTTTILLNITALLAIIVLANWLWTLTTFWSDVYIGEHKWQTLFFYHLYRLPVLIIIGLSFTAFLTKNPTWLIGSVLLDFPAHYYSYGAIWLLREQLTTPELIEQVPLLNEWLILVLVNVSVITFVYHWVSKQNVFITLSSGTKCVFVYMIVLSLLKQVSGSLSSAIASPLIYLSSQQWTFLEQIQFFFSALPHIFLALLAIWIMITQRYQYFLVIILAGVYYTFLADIPLIQGIPLSWGKTNIIAVTGVISAVSMLIFYLSSFIIFAVWLHHWEQEKK